MLPSKLALFLTLVFAITAFTQQPSAARNPKPAPDEPQKSQSEEPPSKVPTSAAARESQPSARHAEEPKPEAAKEAAEKKEEEHYDMTEVAPVVTHHQITLDGRPLRYTATAGRLPIKRDDGKIEAEMFFVAYTLDGQDASRRPLVFAFNGGPGSASVWLHMGALGPKRVVLQPNGFMPASPYRFADNQYTLLDRADLVLVDAIGTGFSRAANAELSKKFWGVKGDIEAFGEFIRMYISRYERWSSPLYLLGESYGTTRAAGVAGYVADRGISFNGITLLSTVLKFQTLQWTKSNDEPYWLILPSYTMIAAYHKRLAPDLMQDLGKTRQEVEQWASNEYARALAKGDALTPDERQRIIDQLARYTGLSKQVIDEANLRINVAVFTHNLLIDQKVRVGRLDGRFTGPDPEGLLDTRFYDPTGSAILPPFTSIFNNYVRTELGYKSDMPYRVLAFQDEGAFSKWDWGSAIQGFPDTATALRAAMVKDPYLKVLVMEGYYDLATPFYAADYTMDQMDLSAAYRKNISFATYDCGHMVYLDLNSLAKMKRDQVEFMQKTLVQ
ncbi:MAG TPA: peptidase S10 [Terriglobales bacterium]|nr:peptidase S10 [Terriglobales bacterium]